MFENNKISLVRCTYEKEWKEYHRIRKEQIFDSINIKYDPKHPTITADNHYHFVLYESTEIIATAHLELLNKTEATLRSLAVDGSRQNKGFGKYMMQLLEKWLKHRYVIVLKMHARPEAETFYRKLGYIDMEFNDVSIQKNYIDLGKML
ncbi:MAG: GNAT family N-acetyltransferase [Rickettsia endosymbiont of Pentastiridius leporinus]